MADPVLLHGYRYSVYNRIARLALLSKTVEHETIEVDPFAELFETSAITRYVDRAFKGPPLQPERAAALARMDQVIAVIDAYAYWPMVRQVSSHAFFRPFVGEPSSREEVDLGLEASGKVLSFLDRVAAEGAVLTGRDITLADCHLAPMMDYFVRAEEGKAALSPHLALQRWWDRVSVLDILKATDPFAVHATSR